MRCGAFLRGAFGARKQSPESLAQIKLWARIALQAPEETAFAVNEIVCNDPACPGSETVILIMAPGRKTRACRVPKSADEVTEQDVRQALGA
jgi:hypothetical protein